MKSPAVPTKRLAAICLFTAFAALPACSQTSGDRPRPSGPWMNTSLSADERAAMLVRELTLDEKISLVHGVGWGPLFGGEQVKGYNGAAGFVPGIARVGMPDLQMADAAVGVTRAAAFGRYSTPLPSAIAEASTWLERSAVSFSLS